MKRYINKTARGRSEANIKNMVIDSIGAIFLLIILFGSLYTVEEGHVGIKKRFSEAVAQVDPGLHIKLPLVESITEMEFRTRKNVESMTSSTSEQMPVTVTVSVNWTVNKIAALELYRKYGGLSQFENRILDPRFRAATKDIIPHATAEELIRDRSSSVAGIEEALAIAMADFPVVVDSVQIENITLPIKYIASIETKQTEKNLAAAEEHKLARQALTAEQAVNTAKATRDATMATADGRAYSIVEQAKADATAIEVKGLAEAAAIKAKSTALKNNPLIVKLTEAQNWNGQLPHTMLSGGALPIMNLK